MKLGHFFFVSSTMVSGHFRFSDPPRVQKRLQEPVPGAQQGVGESEQEQVSPIRTVGNH